MYLKFLHCPSLKFLLPALSARPSAAVSAGIASTSTRCEILLQMSVCFVLVTTVNCAKTAEPIEMTFRGGERTRVGSKEPCTRLVGAYGRRLATTIKRFLLGCDAGCR